MAIDLYLGGRKLTLEDDVTTAKQNITQNASDISDIQATLTKLENTEATTGSIRNITKGYFDDLTAADVPVEDTAENFTGTDVEAILAELFTEVTRVRDELIVTTDSHEDQLSGDVTYTFTQNNSQVTTVTIPADVHVTGGSVVDRSGVKYIVLTTDDGDVEIDASSLVEYITGGSNAEIVMSVDNSTHALTATIAKISAEKIDVDENNTVKDVLDNLDTNKADKTQLVSNQIAYGDGSTVKAALDQNASGIKNVTDTVGNTSVLDEGETLVQYLEDELSNFGGLNSSITSETGKILTGVTITDGLISASTKIDLDAQNMAYDQTDTVKDKLDDIKDDMNTLDTKIGNVPQYQGADQTLVEYADRTVEDFELQAINMSVADADNNFPGVDKNGEAILASIAESCMWLPLSSS